MWKSHHSCFILPQISPTNQKTHFTRPVVAAYCDVQSIMHIAPHACIGDLLCLVIVSSSLELILPFSSFSLMWVRVRMGRECWAFVSAYGPGCERSEEERDEFWNELTRCVDGLSTRNYVVVLGDLNARVGDGELEGVVGKYGVPGENESGERLLDMCVEQELAIGNSFFKKKGINKYTWIRVANGRVIERALMDYVLITKNGW